MVDLVVREGALTVGSRINNILGSKYTLSIFEKRLCQAQYTGMTRIEISICQAAIQDYGLPWALFSRFFNQRMQAAMEYLVSTVLNHRQSLTLTYRRLPIYRLMERLGSCKENLLVIGISSSWLINARTASPWHFVGTRLPIGLTTSASNESHWK